MRGKKNREVNIFSASVVDLFASGLGVFLIVSIIALVNQKKESQKIQSEHSKAKAEASSKEFKETFSVNGKNAKSEADLEKVLELKKLVKEMKIELDITKSKLDSLKDQSTLELSGLKNELNLKEEEIKKLKVSSQKSESSLEKDKMIAKLLNSVSLSEKYGKYDIGTKIRLEDVHFYPGTESAIEPYATKEILEFSVFMKNNPQVYVEVSGHIFETKDAIAKGKAMDDYNLSGKRARFVCNRLVEFGVSAKRLKCVGYGASRPSHLTNDQYSEEAQLNRRVEIEILSK